MDESWTTTLISQRNPHHIAHAALLLDCLPKIHAEIPAEKFQQNAGKHEHLI
ncbi:MAG: hypothetical protein RI957_650 [Verrucomicrobiota bacterium]|jgi:hypothetical protein